MQKIKYWLSAVMVALLALVIPMGCDDGGSGDNGELDAYFASHPYVSAPRDGGPVIVTLTPSSATLSTVGEKASFSMSGGTAPYSWDVSDSSKGSISASGGQGVYTVTAVGKNDVIAYDRNGNAAIAKISGSDSSTATPLTVSASPSQLAKDGDLAVLTAAGGTGPYSWSVLSTPTLGILPNGSTGTTVVYKRMGAGDNAVTVTDSLGASANIVIKQP
jgi:hypothetical protein